MSIEPQSKKEKKGRRSKTAFLLAVLRTHRVEVKYRLPLAHHKKVTLRFLISLELSHKAIKALKNSYPK